jgi:hypothetical protein
VNEILEFHPVKMTPADSPLGGYSSNHWASWHFSVRVSCVNAEQFDGCERGGLLHVRFNGVRTVEGARNPRTASSRPRGLLKIQIQDRSHFSAAGSNNPLSLVARYFSSRIDLSSGYVMILKFLTFALHRRFVYA